MDNTKSCPVESYSRDPKLRPERLCPQSHAIARFEIQIETGNEFLNFNLIKKRDPSHERSCKN